MRITKTEPMLWAQKPRPPTLPAGLFRPKQTLSQNFLCDPNYVFKIVSTVDDESRGGRRLVELGPGTGALTTRLHPRFPEMLGIDIDQRALRVLSQNVPGVTGIRSDVLLVNYTAVSELRGGPLTIIGNLPYHISSQVLFKLLDHSASVRMASVMLQKEVAKRICARPKTKEYNQVSVAFQLYANVRILFDVPPTAFFPRPKVESSFVRLDFEGAEERRLALKVDPRDLRNLTKTAFTHRNKILRNSIQHLLNCHMTLIDRLPEEYEFKRPNELEPWEFVHLTQMVFGKKEFPRHLRLAWRGEFGRTVTKKKNPHYLAFQPQ